MSRQVCRYWLKHKYLGLGKPCNGEMSSSDCKRKHELPSNIKLLYKDYSFMSLRAVQRKIILAKAVGEEEAVGVTDALEREKHEHSQEDKEGRHKEGTQPPKLKKTKKRKLENDILKGGEKVI